MNGLLDRITQFGFFGAECKTVKETVILIDQFLKCQVHFVNNATKQVECFIVAPVKLLNRPASMNQIAGQFGQ